MFFWTRKRLAKEEAEAKREAKILSIQKDTKNKINAAVESAEKAIEKLSGNDLAENLFYATGGGRRRHARR